MEPPSSSLLIGLSAPVAYIEDAREEVIIIECVRLDTQCLVSSLSSSTNRGRANEGEEIIRTGDPISLLQRSEQHSHKCWTCRAKCLKKLARGFLDDRVDCRVRVLIYGIIRESIAMRGALTSSSLASDEDIWIRCKLQELERTDEPLTIL